MVIEVFAAKTHLEGTRNRVITCWNIVADKFGVYLTGILVAGENEIPLAEGASMRITSTSYIKSIDGFNITTISGSTYFLLDPSPNYIRDLEKLGSEYDKANPLGWLEL